MSDQEWKTLHNLTIYYEVIKDNEMLLTSLSLGKVHDFNTNSLENLLHWYWLQVRPMGLTL